jgi:hypothetical protein
MTPALRIVFAGSLLLVGSATRASSPDESKPAKTRMKYDAILAEYDKATKRYRARVEKVKATKEI